jgi:hypothetical protein
MEISAFCFRLHVSLDPCMTQHLIQKTNKAVTNYSSNTKCWNDVGCGKGELHAARNNNKSKFNSGNDYYHSNYSLPLLRLPSRT